MSSNKLVMCPYDEAHKVKESRLQLHLTKCRSNHLHEDKFVCPFNATHVFPRKERDYHLLHCADKAPLDRKLAQSIDKNNPFKGRTAVPSYSESVPIVTDEIWDDDFGVSEGPGYQPPSEPPAGAIIEPPALSKPAERKRLYQELFRTSTDVTEVKPPLPTVPKQPSEPYRLQSQAQECQNIGRGRGVVPSRIAANIFPSQMVPTNRSSSEISYSAAITTGLIQLGLGRGQVNTPPVSVAHTQPNMFDDEDEFPALGFGRGINRNPKNGIKTPGNRY